MEQLISEILEIEQRAQQIVDEARAARDGFDRRLQEDAEALRKQMEVRKQRRIGLVRDSEEKHASEEIAEIRRHCAKVCDKLDEAAKANFDRFVSEITDSVLGG